MELLLEYLDKSICKRFVVYVVKSLTEVFICYHQVKWIAEGNSSRKRAGIRFLQTDNRKYLIQIHSTHEYNKLSFEADIKKPVNSIPPPYISQEYLHQATIPQHTYLRWGIEHQHGPQQLANLQ